MSIKDLIQSAMESDATSFEKAFENIMSEKMGIALEAKYESMYEEKDMEDEDDEDEDEDDEDEMDGDDEEEDEE